MKAQAEAKSPKKKKTQKYTVTRDVRIGTSAIVVEIATKTARKSDKTQEKEDDDIGALVGDESTVSLALIYIIVHCVSPNLFIISGCSFFSRLHPPLSRTRFLRPQYPLAPNRAIIFNTLLMGDRD